MPVLTSSVATQVFVVTTCVTTDHDDIIKWKHFPRYWLFVRGIHRSPVNFPHKGQWRWAFVFFDLRLNKPLCKQPGGLRFETPSLPLWRHCVDEVGIMTQRAISFIVKEDLRAVNRIIFCIWWEMQPIVSDSVFFIKHLIHRWWWNHVTSPCCLLTIRDPFY